MKLNELIESTPELGWEHRRGTRDGRSVDLSFVTDDSRRVTPGAIFVARSGSMRDGSSFIEDAISRGAVVVVTGRGDAGGHGASRGGARSEAHGVSRPAASHPTEGPVHLTVADPARALGRIAHALERWPTQSLRVVGVTGTNGKTTITCLVRQLLEGAGVRCGLMGTVEVHDGARAVPASLTTPGADVVARTLGRMVRHGCTRAAIEVSSHALDQSRVEGVEFAVAVFTNLTGDHLDYHGSMEAYASAKAKLFERLAPEALAIVNEDDPWHRRMLRDCGAPVLRCRRADGTGGSSDAADIATVRVLDSSLTGMRAAFDGPWGRIEARVPLAGAHNAMNALQAIAAAHRLGADRGSIERTIPGLAAPPGRLQPVTGPDAPFQVLVDYAHTDDALANVLGAIRPLIPDGGRSIVVFGCGGDRDRTKRPRMAAVACRLADRIFVTSDNPRREEPESIIDEIMTGVSAADLPRVMRDADRARAIEAAIQSARPGDVVLIAGKGHEGSQEVGTERRPFDDREIARGVLGRHRVGAGGGA